MSSVDSFLGSEGNARSPDATPLTVRNKDLVISVVISVHNEQDYIELFISKATAVLHQHFKNYELILVDDGSTDDTVRIILERISKDKNIRLLVLTRRYGEEVAITAGLDHAIGDYVVLMAAHRGDPPQLIPKLVRRAQEGYDIVYAAKDPRNSGPLLYRLGTKFFYRLTFRLSGLDVPPEATDFRVLSRRVVNSISRLKEHNRSMRMLYAYVGFKSDGIPLESFNDWPKKAEYRYRGKWQLVLDVILAFSDKPLRYVSILSMGVSLIALIGAIYVVIQRFRSDGLVEGWASLMVVQLIMFCILFLFLTVISEYISRILIESKNRPLYYVREEHGGTSFDIRSIIDAD